MGSDVKAGENQGRHLAHDFVVGSLAHVRMEKSGEMFQADIVVGPEQKLSSGRLALAVWVTRDGELEVLQATGGWLQPINENDPHGIHRSRRLLSGLLQRRE